MSLTAVCCFVACLLGCQAAPSVEAPLDVLHPNIGTLGSGLKAKTIRQLLSVIDKVPCSTVARYGAAPTLVNDAFAGAGQTTPAVA
jgi:hypothetical protein